MTPVNNTARLGTPNKQMHKTNLVNQLMARYWAYADRQSSQQMLWYILVLAFIPGVYMVLFNIAMMHLVVNFPIFVAFSMLLFYVNVLIHIAEMSSRVYVSFFYFTTFLFIIIPFITYLFV